MADRGPHNHECATATGGDCHCDCHGTMHGIMHIPGHGKGHGGKHLPGVKITPVKGHGGKVHYNVTKVDGLPPGGGTQAERLAARSGQVKVTATSKRTATFPPPVASWARKVRETLPKTNEEWNALIPRGESNRSGLLGIIAKREADLADYQRQRDELVASMEKQMKSYGWRPDRRRRELASGKHRDLNFLSETIEHTQNDIAKYRENAASASDEKPYDYPKDPSGLFQMPPPELEKHLERVMTAGRQALEAVRDELRRDDEHKQIRDELGLRREVKRNLDLLTGPKGDKLPPDEQGRRIASEWDRLPDNGMSIPKLERKLRQRESQVIREMLASYRGFGGVQHTTVVMSKPDRGNAFISETFGARDDALERLRVGESFFPDDWLRHSAAEPLDLTTSDRAFYMGMKWSAGGVLSMNTPAWDKAHYDGAFADDTDETTVHELGHRMEQVVPGLTHLEFALVRKRSTGPDGTLERSRKLSEIIGSSAYASHEVAFEDQWKHPYAGKTYESRDDHPAGQSWEVFQVGTQDLFGRSSTRYGDEDLQAFMLGALMTLT